MDEVYLGVDLGTTACKCAIIDSRGRLLGESSADYPLITLSPKEVEQDAEEWWRGALTAIGEAARKADVAPERIAALAVSSQGISFVPVDEGGRPLRRAISWLDSRAEAEAREILDAFSSERLFQMTGKRASSFYVLPKLLWLRKHEPEVFERTHRFLLAHDYLVHRLTGMFVTDHALASGFLLHDVKRRVWSEEMVSRFDIPKTALPDTMNAGEAAGPVAPAAARETGLTSQTRVVVGSQDQKCAAYAAEAGPGVATISLGTATAISAVVRSPMLDPKMRIPCFPYVEPDRWILEGVVSTSGAAVQWFRDQVYKGGYQLMDLAAQGEMDATVSLFFFPHLAGAGSPVWNAPHGGAFTGLSLHASAAAMARAVLEGVAFQIRSNLEVLGELNVKPNMLHAFGGGARSDVWIQIIADVAGLPVSVYHNPESAAIGSCMLAALGAGREIAFEKTGRVVEPDSVRAGEYAERYGRYRRVEGLVVSDQ